MSWGEMEGKEWRRRRRRKRGRRGERGRGRWGWWDMGDGGERVGRVVDRDEKKILGKTCGMGCVYGTHYSAFEGPKPHRNFDSQPLMYMLELTDE